MSLSYKKSRSGDYYTNCMTAELLNDVDSSKMPGHRVDDYYTAGAKEPPGEWYLAADHNGQRSDFGLADGQVFGADDVEHFHALCKGYNPQGGKALVQNAGKKDRVALHDFTFTAPKSFSVVWSQTDASGRERIQDAQRSAVRDALDFFSEKGAWTRQGKGGHIKTKTQFVAGLFEHGSSRADDPLLHIHATILNVCRRPDGSTGSIETIEAMRWQGAVASMYHAGLAHKLRAMGASIDMDGKIPEVAGVPRHVIDAFSQRRKAIEAAVEQWQAEKGLTQDASRASRGLLQKAWNETRDAKNELTRDELEQLWLDRGQQLGFSEQQVREVMSLGQPLEQLTPEQLLEEAKDAVAKMTETDATFREPALYTAVAVHLCGRASVEDIKAAVDAVKPELVHTERLANTDTGEMEVIYSTREMLVIERDLVERVKAKTPEHRLDKAFVEKFISEKNQACLEAAMQSIIEKGGDPADASGLADEQMAAMRYVTQSDNQVVVVEGTAGAGKTFTAESIAAMFKGQGYEVHGLSGAWAQALNLQQEAKLDSGRAIAGWLADIERGNLVLNKKSLVILDEAGMVGARDLRNVTRAVQDAGAKLVLLGDTLQQSSVSAGDALRVTVGEIGSTRLDIIRRQRSESDRAAVHEFFAGKAVDALARYEGRIHIEADAESTNARIIKDWMASRIKNPEKSHLILALDNASVDDLNRKAHQMRKDCGELGPKSVQLHTMSSKDETDQLEFSQGDRVVFRVNNRGMSTADKASLKVLGEYRDAIKVLAKMESELAKRERKVAGITAKEAVEQDRLERAQAAGRSYEPKSFTREKNHEMAQLLEQRTLLDNQLRSMANHFGGNANAYSKEVADRCNLLLASGDTRHSGYLRSHATDVHARIKGSDSEKAGDVFNRVRGTLEDIDEKTGVLTVRTDEGKLVKVDPNDEKWQHKDGGLGLQHDYATSIYASQGLTRDIVFVKDHFGMTRKQAGVAFSRHRDDCHSYVDREARYEAKMRETASDDWHHIDEFSNEECIARMGRAYSRTSDKESTLDYEEWRDHQGTRLHPDNDLTLDRIHHLREHLAKAQASDKSEPELPFQQEDWYALADREQATAEQQTATRDALADEGIKGSVMVEAEKQGFMSYGADGKVSFNGRRPMDDKVVNRVTDGKAEEGALRDRYPPILRGDDKEVHIVRSGQDALALWSNRDREGKARPTVIVAHGNVKEATSLAHVRHLLSRSEKPLTVHADTKAAPQREGQTQKQPEKAEQRDLAIASKKDVDQVKQSKEAPPREEAKKAERSERQLTLQETESRKRKPTLGG